RMGILDDPYCLYADTMLASYALDERPGHHGLGVLGIEVLGTPDWKSVTDRYVKKGESYALIPRNVLYQYNAYDCAVTMQLWQYFEPKLEKLDLRRVHDRLVMYSHELIYVELFGIAVDMEYNTELLETYLDGLVDLRAALQPLAKDRFVPPKSAKTDEFNPNSPKQVAQVLKSYGFNVASTDEDTLKALD